MADRTLDSLPFDMTNTLQKSGAHLITLLGMSSALNSLQINTILESFSEQDYWVLRISERKIAILFGEPGNALLQRGT